MTDENTVQEKNSGWKKWAEFAGVAAFMFVIGIGAYSFANLGVFNNIDNAIAVFDGLGWFVGSFALATLFTSYLVVIADTKFIFRFLAIPAWLGFSLALLVALDQFLGYTYPSYPPRAELLSYRMIRDADTNKRMVEAWMYLTDERRTRSYIFPYDKDQEEALYRAMRLKARGAQGVEVELGDPTKLKKHEDRPKPEDMIKYDIRHQGLPLKEYVGEKNMTEGTGDRGAQDLGQHRQDDKFIIQMPGGGQIEVERGSSFSITPEGEIEILDPGSKKQSQIKDPNASAVPLNNYNHAVQQYNPDQSTAQQAIDSSPSRHNNTGPHPSGSIDNATSCDTCPSEDTPH